MWCLFPSKVRRWQLHCGQEESKAQILIVERGQLRLKHRTKEYTVHVAHQEVRKSRGRDKRKHLDELAMQAEEAAAQGNMKGVYDATRKLAARYKQTDKPIKNEQVKTMTTTEEELERWAGHFNELLNRPAPEDLPDISPAAAVQLPIKCGKPSRLENKEAI